MLNRFLVTKLSSYDACFVLPLSPHPYLFFNEDRMTMTFLGFLINSAGDLVDPQTSRTLEKRLISKQLRNGLQAQRVDFAANTEKWKKLVVKATLD